MLCVSFVSQLTASRQQVIKNKAIVHLRVAAMRHACGLMFSHYREECSQ